MRDKLQQSQHTSTPDEAPQGFKRVVLIGLVSLFTDIASEMIFAILPLFVVEELGASTALLGLMEGSAESLNDFFKVVSGLVTDRIRNRKPLLVIGYSISAFSKPLFGLANNFLAALSIRITDRIGKGLRTSARDVLLVESVKEKQRGRAFGFHRAMDQTGAVVGPVLAYLLLPVLGFRGVFLFAIVPGMVSVVIVVFLVHDVIVPQRRSSLRFLEGAKSLLNFRLASYLAVVGIFSAGAYSYAFVLLKAVSLGIDDGTVPLVYATLNIATVVAAVPIGVLADRTGKGKVLLVAYGFFIVTTLSSLDITSGTLYAFLIAIGFGLFVGASDTVQRAIVPGMVPAEFRGTGFALYYIVLAFGTFAANTIFGTLWTYVSMSSAYTYSLVTSMAGLIGLLIVLSLSSVEDPHPIAD